MSQPTGARKAVNDLLGCAGVIALLAIIGAVVTIYDGIKQNQLRNTYGELADVCDGVSHPDHPAYRGESGIHPAIGFLANGNVALNPIPGQAQTRSIEAIELVLCIGERHEELIERCPYLGNNYVERIQTKLAVILYEVKSGEVVASETLVSGSPEACQSIEEFGTSSNGVTKTHKTSVGDLQIERWLATFTVID